MRYFEDIFGAAVATIAIGEMSLLFCYIWPDKDYGLSGWVQAIGSIAAIAGAGYGLRRQMIHAERLAMDARLQSRKDIVVALSAEISVYHDGLVRLDQKIANNLAAMLGGMLQMVFPSASFRFPIYSANANAMWAVSDEKLRRKIIGLYADLDMFYALLDRNSSVAQRIPYNEVPSGEVAYELKELYPLIDELLTRLRPAIDDVIAGLERQLEGS